MGKSRPTAAASVDKVGAGTGSEEGNAYRLDSQQSGEQRGEYEGNAQSSRTEYGTFRTPASEIRLEHIGRKLSCLLVHHDLGSISAPYVRSTMSALK